VKRRDFITLLGGAAAWRAVARAADARARIAVLTLRSKEDIARFVEAFVEALGELGYTDTRRAEIESRYADGDTRLLRPLAQELVAFKPAVSLAAEPSAARALKGVAPLLPLVCPTLTDAVIPDLVASYARPGGTVTGVAQSVEAMTGKLLELAIELVPGIARVGFLYNPSGASMRFFAEAVYQGARDHSMTVATENAQTPEEINSAFDRLIAQQVQAVLVPANGLFIAQRARIVQIALAAHLPTIFPQNSDVQAGGLASYGVDQRENFRRVAIYTDKILKGANPGDLPVEFPTKIELTINLKTAKALGLTVPPSLLARADEVIE